MAVAPRSGQGNAWGPPPPADPTGESPSKASLLPLLLQRLRFSHLLVCIPLLLVTVTLQLCHLLLVLLLQQHAISELLQLPCGLCLLPCLVLVLHPTRSCCLRLQHSNPPCWTMHAMLIPLQPHSCIICKPGHPHHLLLAQLHGHSLCSDQHIHCKPGLPSSTCSSCCCLVQAPCG
jgi:hypothetical protein